MDHDYPSDYDRANHKTIRHEIIHEAKKMHQRLKQILEDTEHPIAREILRNIFEARNASEILNANARDRILEQKNRIWFDVDAMDWVEFGDDLTELSHELLDRYHQKASAQLRRGTYAKPSDNIKTRTRKPIHRYRGVKRANSGLNSYNTDEFNVGEEEEQSEAIGSAIGNFAASAVTSTVAHGLGVSSSDLHRFTTDLMKKNPKLPKPTASTTKTKHVKPPAPQHKSQTASASSHSASKWEPVEMHHVYSGKVTDDEHHLVQALNHHNIGSFAKSKGDHSKAEIHFRARDKHFKSYVTNAPHENLKKLNQDKVKRIFN